jgi:hypothetical protein
MKITLMAVDSLIVKPWPSWFFRPSVSALSLCSLCLWYHITSRATGPSSPHWPRSSGSCIEQFSFPLWLLLIDSFLSGYASKEMTVVTQSLPITVRAAYWIVQNYRAYRAFVPVEKKTKISLPKAMGRKGKHCHQRGKLKVKVVQIWLSIW